MRTSRFLNKVRHWALILKSDVIALWLGIKLLHGVLGIASLDTVRDLAAKLIGEPGEEVDLTAYV